MRASILTGVIMPVYALAYAVEYVTAMPPVPRQNLGDFASAQQYLTACADSCTDDIQSRYQRARLDVNPDDQYCNNFGNTPGDGACYCGNYLDDSRSVLSLSSCIANTCTQISEDVVDVTGEFIPVMTAQLNLLCPNSVNQFSHTFDVQPPSTNSFSVTTTTMSSTSKSTSRLSSSSAMPSLSSSSTASSTFKSTSTFTSASSTATGTPTSSSDSAPKVLVLMDSVYLTTTLCGVIMAVTAYML
ncbi:uncharacterized protein BT62DRAFT_225378 [Guyanagaster necrorhizus]|uniref:Extracellular membrane protein CFEM domain-containing protein n=1 Tax=Guyanagaster necrorhizus TaxID=856835 RepID=A0A9P7VP18_9AGAR|nr:uncharacterized protein BT62DRAFT_225378 [Guyanagaster necrorhizus MCA 3950]KAG7444748.1 hypothetical protein BT62DRAFT_225378 [Guyanagaster necrorhizus MCA 3950]